MFNIEQLAEGLHNSWMRAKQEQGITSRLNEQGQEQMVPWTELPEASKELSRQPARDVVEQILLQMKARGISEVVPEGAEKVEDKNINEVMQAIASWVAASHALFKHMMQIPEGTAVVMSEGGQVLEIVLEGDNLATFKCGLISMQEHLQNFPIRFTATAPEPQEANDGNHTTH